MRISRVYQDAQLDVGSVIQLDSAAANHISNVLRLSVDDSLILFNGRGGEYSASVSSIVKKKVSVKIEKFFAVEHESNLKIHLLQGISRGEKMDFAIQKAVELGVASITPILTKRCGVKLAKERWSKKIEHWQKVVVSACEQCGRNTVPVINGVASLPSFCSLIAESGNTKLILNGYTKKTLADIKKVSTKITLLIGPEGGFADDEVVLAEKSGFQSIKLGPRVLRTETAALAAISVLQSTWGDLA